MYSFLFSHVNNITMMALQVSEDEVLSVCNVVPACQDVFHEQA
jgi:intracellular sulfur oxidation DsrE/DsrF family protein